MTKAQIKYYHLLKEIVEIKESNRKIFESLGWENYGADARDKSKEEIRDDIKQMGEILNNPKNQMKLGEQSANMKRFREINKILQDKYQMEKQTTFLLELTRDKLPKHMILPDGNYFKIEYQGIVYENTPAQAIFIEKAHQLFLDGSKTFNAPKIMIEMQLENHQYTNITELFKGNPINGSLIKKEKRAIYSLDIEI